MGEPTRTSRKGAMGTRLAPVGRWPGVGWAPAQQRPGRSKTREREQQRGARQERRNELSPSIYRDGGKRKRSPSIAKAPFSEKEAIWEMKERSADNKPRQTSAKQLEVAGSELQQQPPPLPATVGRAVYFAPNTWFRCVNSVCMSIGLTICPFMPAANARWRSSSNALAVMAMIGMFALRLSASVRISRVAV